MLCIDTENFQTVSKAELPSNKVLLMMNYVEKVRILLSRVIHEICGYFSELFHLSL